MSMQRPDNVVREFPQLGRYRLRVLELDNGRQCLDIREFVENSTFEGFTKRGVRLPLPRSIDVLKQVFAELDGAPSPVPAREASVVRESDPAPASAA